MRKIKEVLRLTHDGALNKRQVALNLNISRSTVKDYQTRAQKAGLSWPLPEDLTEEAREEKQNITGSDRATSLHHRRFHPRG